MNTPQWVALTAVLLGLAACAGASIPDAKQSRGRNPLVAEAPSPDETVRGEDDPAIVTLNLGSMLHEHRLLAGDPLPVSTIVPSTNLTGVPVSTALQAVLAGTDVSLSWNIGSLGDRLVTVMNLSGPLPQVVDKICASARVFCAYRHGSLEITDTETFVVSMPPMTKTMGSGAAGAASSSGGSNSMVEALKELIGGKAQVDEQGGNIVYTADFDAEDRVSNYLNQLRHGRPLVVLQLYIWEVTLNRESAEGIKWNKFSTSAFGPDFSKITLNGTSNLSTVASSTGGMSLGAVTAGRMSIDALSTFLSTQGRVQTVSNPQVTFVSGSGSTFKVGGTKRYISQVGNSTSNVSGSTSNTTTGTTVQTDTINTGLEVNIGGTYENGVVFANLEMKLSNLVNLNPTDTGSGLVIDLPETSDENISTNIRVRPGDNLVMAGLVTSKDTNTRQGIPFFGDTRLPLYGNDQTENRELVIVVKPSIILFADKPQEAPKKPESPKPLADVAPIVVPVDKVAAPVSVESPQSVASKEPAVGINGSSMQRGLSQAFNQAHLEPKANAEVNP